MIHRNTYINSPSVLRPTFQTRKRESLLFAGQISGVEGYTESAASGLIAGINAARLARGERTLAPPPTTALGALCHYISNAEVTRYQPTNIAFGLFPALDPPVKDKKTRNQALVERALADLEDFARVTAP
jgi:methylenetetrahydrofolate--tRNA-(uracil-5-)-methyltransferase